MECAHHGVLRGASRAILPPPVDVGFNRLRPSKAVRQSPMRTEQPTPVRLQDYRPPDWLVETVHLDVALDRTATRVRATLALKPNPQAAAPAPLVLDGDALNLVSLRLDGELLPAERYVATPERLTIAQVPRVAFRL